MLTTAELRKRALRKKRDTIHAQQRPRDTRDAFWSELFRSAAPADSSADPPAAEGVPPSTAH
jgi:hypothetical protein